jgi:predicted small secreted protein
MLGAFTLSGCGNTIKGIGSDIVSVGESIMKKETKDVTNK